MRMLVKQGVFLIVTILLAMVIYGVMSVLRH